MDLENSKIEEIVTRLPELIRNFEYRKGPDLYFYRKTIALRRGNTLHDLLSNADDKFLESIYATLVAWDMNSRRAKMVYFDEFKKQILKNKNDFWSLENLRLEELTNTEFESACLALERIFDNMKLMYSGKKLVSNSKVMHFILPDLVMPMDGNNTQKFFFGNDNEAKGRFRTLLDYSRHICRYFNFKQIAFNDEWNQSIPKIIDNAILSKMIPKYHKINRSVLLELKDGSKNVVELENSLRIRRALIDMAIKDLRELNLIMETPENRFKKVPKKQFAESNH